MKKLHDKSGVFVSKFFLGRENMKFIDLFYENRLLEGNSFWPEIKVKTFLEISILNVTVFLFFAQNTFIS